MQSPPIIVEVYDKTFKQLGTVGAFGFCTVIVKWMAPGLATIEIPAGHRRVPDLVQIGARMRFLNSEGKHLLSGFVARYRISGPSESRATIEFDVVDDFIILQRILGWVVPGGAITAQGTAGTNWELEGSAETVMKEALRLNGVERLGLPILIPPTLGRGATVKARLRFQTLFDRLIPVEDGAGIINSGIGLGVKQRTDGVAGLELETWVPKTVPQTINQDSGIIKSWAVDHENATATRGVAGGQGEGQLRLFRERVDAALEASLGWKFEVYRDARDSDDPTVMYERLDETLAESSGRNGMSVEFMQTKNFMVAPGKLWVGDQLTLSVAGIQVTERLQEATLSWTAKEGFVTRPRIGDKSDDPDKILGTIINRIARSIRNRNSET